MHRLDIVVFTLLNIFQSVWKRHTVMTHKINTKNSQPHKLPRDSSYLNEKNTIIKAISQSLLQSIDKSSS